jgi:hypothetical protein
MSNHETARPKRKLILTRETVQTLDSSIAADHASEHSNSSQQSNSQHSNSGQDSKNTKRKADCDSTALVGPRLPPEWWR